MNHQPTLTFVVDGESSPGCLKEKDSKQSDLQKMIQPHQPGSKKNGQSFQTTDVSVPFQSSDAELLPLDFPAKTLAIADQKRASTDQGRLFGSESEIAWLDADPIFAYLKTQVQSKCEDLTGYCPTWSKSVTPQGRLTWTLSVSEHHITAPGLTFSRTPMASDNRDRGDVSQPVVQRRIRLGKQIGLSMLFKGTPCPLCVAGMMGFDASRAKRLTDFLETQLFPLSRKSLRKPSTKV